MAIKILSGIDVIGDMNITAADVPALDASKISTGAFDAARIPNLPASKITSGAFDIARIPDLSSLYASSTITLADLGYTGDTNANYITNNNQLTNGAGYITSYTETDTLDSVTSRGNSTSNSIAVNALGASGNIETQANIKSGGYLLFDQDGDFSGGNYYTMEDHVDGYFRMGYAFNSNLVISTAGNIGIGTTSPDAKLDVAGNFRINEGNSFTDFDIKSDRTSGNIGGVNFVNASDDIKGQVYGHTDGSVKIASGGTSVAMTILSGGNVGIGTTSPSYKLDVNGDINIPNNSALFVDGALALTQDSASGFTSIGLGGALSVNPIQFTMTFNGADVLFGSLSSGAIPAKATFGVGDSGIVSDFPPSEVLRISSSSNVGIGVTNPSEKLEVNGNILAPSNSSAQLGRVYARNGIATDTNSQENLLNNTTRINGVLKDQFGNTGGSAGAYNLTTRTLAAFNNKPYWYESYRHGSWSSINYKTNGSTFTPSFKKGYYTVNDYNVRVHGVFQVNSPMLIRNFVNDTNGTAAITSLPFAPANGLVNSSFSGYYDWNWGNILNAVEGGPLGTWVQLDAGRNFVRSGVMVGVTLDFSGTDLIVVAFMGGDTAPEYEIPVNHYIKFNFEYLKA